MKLSDLTRAGHWPTLLAAFRYSDFSFMVWTVLGPLSVQIGESLKLTPEEKGLVVAVGMEKSRWRTTWGALAGA